jgi:hypothetical protein
MNYKIEIFIRDGERDGESDNTLGQLITITLQNNCALEAIEKYAKESAYCAAGFFGNVGPIVNWRIYRNGALLSANTTKL